MAVRDKNQRVYRALVYITTTLFSESLRLT